VQHFVAAISRQGAGLVDPAPGLLFLLRQQDSAISVFSQAGGWFAGPRDYFLDQRLQPNVTVGWAAGVANLHNRDEIDRILENTGPSPPGSDVERITRGYEAFGEDWFLQLRGPFSVLLCCKSGKVVVVRDQMGLSPVYYLSNSSGFYVSTDLRLLTELDCFERTPDPIGLTHVASGFWGNAETTVWRDVRRLPGGHCLAIRGDGVEVTDYWAPDKRLVIQRAAPMEYFAREIASRLRVAVDRCTGAGRVAMELSGGMDSSTIAGFVAQSGKQIGGPPIAVTWDIDDPRCDERHFARAVVDLHNLEWQLMSAHSTRQAAIDRSRRWQDAPGGYSCDQVERAQRLSRQLGATHYLTGNFGDSLFAGENWAGFMEYIYRMDPYNLLKYSHWGRRLIPNIRDLLKAHPTYLGYANRFRPLVDEGILARDLRAAAGLDRRPITVNPFDRQAPLQSRVRLLRQPQLQRVVELYCRFSSESGLIPGHPLADVDLVEYVLTVPPAYFMGRPANRVLQAEAAGPLLPDEVAHRADKADGTPYAISAILAQAPEALIKNSVMADNGWIDSDRAISALHQVLRLEADQQPVGKALWEIVGLVEAEIFLQNAL
jgi:asparagine synthase (glutamine-hydrolysing)